MDGQANEQQPQKEAAKEAWANRAIWTESGGRLAPTLQWGYREQQTGLGGEDPQMDVSLNATRHSPARALTGSHAHSTATEETYPAPHFTLRGQQTLAFSYKTHHVLHWIDQSPRSGETHAQAKHSKYPQPNHTVRASIHNGLSQAFLSLIALLKASKASAKASSLPAVGFEG